MITIKPCHFFWMTALQQAEIQTFMKHAISLQYHFYTFNPIPHAVCTPECIMRSEPSYDPNISVCSRDSRNIHICTATLCKVFFFYHLIHVYEKV